MFCHETLRNACSECDWKEVEDHNLVTDSEDNKVNATAKFMECEWREVVSKVADSVEYLRYFLSPNSLTMLQDKVKTICDWPEPCKMQDIQSFLGFTNFYHQFIFNYSDIVVPLTCPLWLLWCLPMVIQPTQGGLHFSSHPYLFPARHTTNGQDWHIGLCNHQYLVHHWFGWWDTTNHILLLAFWLCLS